MIEKVTTKNEYLLVNILEFLNSYEDSDFYFVRDNVRIYVRDVQVLKSLIRESICCYAYLDNGDCKGVIVVWKSYIEDKKKFNLRVNAKNSKIAVDLLTIVLWNYNIELHSKVDKSSKFVESLKFKGFRHVFSKGNKILLERKANPLVSPIYSKKEDN